MTLKKVELTQGKSAPLTHVGQPRKISFTALAQVDVPLTWTVAEDAKAGKQTGYKGSDCKRHSLI